MEAADYKQLKIDLEEVESDFLCAYGYDEEHQVLDLEFNSGYFIYRYSNVPKKVVDQLLSSPKNGAFFNKEIRNHYPCYKLKLKDVYANDPHYEYLKN